MLKNKISNRKALRYISVPNGVYFTKTFNI